MDLNEISFATFICDINLADNFFCNIKNFCNEDINVKNISDFQNLHMCLRVASNIQDEGLIQGYMFDTVQQSCIKIISEICDLYIVNVVENYQNSVDVYNNIKEIISHCVKIAGSKIESSIFSSLFSLLEIFDTFDGDLSNEKQVAVLDIISSILLCIPTNILVGKSDLWRKLFSVSMLSRKAINASLVSKILPIIIKKVGYYNEAFILNLVWDFIKLKFFTIKEDFHGNDGQGIFAMLSTLVDIALNITHLQKMYTEEVIFWEILFFGLAHCNSVIRKHVQYVFKRILHWAKSAHTRIEIPAKPPMYFIYDSACPDLKDSMTAWDDLLSVFEVLEQKQLHIIKPHLSKVLHLLQLSKHAGNCVSDTVFNFHTLWIMTLLQRMWKHDAKYIKYWSIVCVLNHKEPCIFPNPNEKSTYLFFEELFEVLNDPSIYVRPEYGADETLCINHENIEKFFLMYSNSFSTSTNTGHFLQLILYILSNSSFSAVPLLYIMKAIAQIPSCEAWKRTDISNICKVLRKALQTQELLLQQAIVYNLLKASIQHLDLKDLPYTDLSLFLNAFIDCNALVPKSLLWTEMTDSLRQIFFYGSSPLLSINIMRKSSYKDLVFILNLLQNNHTNDDSAGSEILPESIKQIARTWSVLVEANVFCSEPCEMKSTHQCLSFSTFISPLFKMMETTLSQPFFLSGTTRNVLTIYFYVVEELDQYPYFHRGHIIWSELVDKMLFQVIERMHELCNVEDLEWIHFSFMTFDALLRNGNDNTKEKLILSVLNQYDFYQAINEVQFWCFIGKIALHARNKDIVCQHIIFIMQKTIANNCLALKFLKPGFVKPDGSKKLWLNCVENATIGICHTLQLYIELSIDSFSESDILFIYQQIFELIKNENKLHIPVLFRSLELTLPKVGNINCVSEALSVSWNCVKIWRFYRPALKAFISVCFQSHLIKKNYPLLMQYFEKLKSLEDRPACLSLLYSHICHIFEKDENRSNCFEYISFLSHGLLFGPIRRKDQRAITEAIENVIDKEVLDEIALKYMKSDFHIRIEVIHVLLTKVQTGDAETFIYSLIEDLLQRHEEMNQNKPSHCLNSYQHRVQNRAWQSVLLLNELLVTKLCRKKLLVKIIKDLFIHNSQTSVKYFQDWTVLKIIHFHPELLEDVFSAIKECFKHQPSYQVRLLSILVHLIKLGIINTSDLALNWMPLIFGFCVTHNFEVRLHAVLALQNLWKYCSHNSYCDVLEKFNFIQDSELINPKTGNFPRNIEQLNKRYYFSSFHPIKSFNFQTIFVELPLHSNVTVQEWIQPSYFISKNKISPFPECFKIFNENVNIFDSSSDIHLSRAQSHANSSKNSVTNGNFQRKFVPHKICDKHVIEKYSGIKNYFESEVKNKKELDLVIVASLVEKLPNLGGLCRSCEAFGVSEFVVKDLKCTEHKMFQSLSVTAEKWITISEVKVHQLKKYLIDMKSQNYFIVGCEQTEKSQKLTEFSFPQKCLILLGNEKEGIPAELFNYLDVSIEIPQNGIICSLNVHVAGALFIYEFFRQHRKF